MTTAFRKEAGGGIRINVLSLGAKASKQETQRIHVPIKIFNETEQLEEEFRLKKAKAALLRDNDVQYVDRHEKSEKEGKI